ncbi:MAG: dynamin family protein [Oscillospiraceae bacterium]|nr:dynamin family protein [Oscillospiraceae bacterium]
MKVELIYDPYRMKTEMCVDGKNVCDSESYEKFKKFIEQGLPIQSWIDAIEYDDWKGFAPELVGGSQESLVTCSFKGRELDFEDFKEAVNSQCRGMKPPVEFKYEPHFTMDDKSVADNIEAAVKLILSEEFTAIINDPLFHATDTLKNAHSNLPSTYHRALDGEFRIVFVGMYSSGKSTIINALLGKEILPTSDDTCTSKVFNIRHDKNVKYAKMCCLSKDGEEVVPAAEYDQNKLKEKFAEIFPRGENGKLVPSNPPTIETIEIWADISLLYPAGFENRFNIVLVDTPGTSSGEGNNVEDGPAHIDITSSVINSPNKEIVVFTTSAIEDKDDSIINFLEVIDRSAENDKDIYNQRFLFVLNKADVCNFNKDEDFGKKLKRVEGYYTTNREAMQTPRFFPVSALAAHEIKLGRVSTKSGDASKYRGIREKYYAKDDETGEWTYTQGRENFYFEKYCSTSQRIKDFLSQQVKPIEEPNDVSVPDIIAQNILIHSGIPSFEMAIKDYIERYAYPLKVMSLLDTFDGILSETSQLNATIHKKLEEALNRKQDSEQTKKAQETERQAEEKRNEGLKNAKIEVEKALRHLDNIDVSNKIKDTVELIKVETRLKLQPILSCVGKRYDSEEAAKGEIKTIFDDANKICIERITELSDVYFDRLSSIFQQVTTAFKSVKDSVHFEQDGFSIENTIAFKSISVTLFNDIKPKRNMISNPKKDIDYHWWQLIEKYRQKKATDMIQDGYRFESKELAGAIDMLSHEVNDSVDEYQKSMINRFETIKGTVRKSMGELLEEIGKINAQLANISLGITNLSNDLSAVSVEMGKYEVYGQLIVQINEKIQLTQKGDTQHG